MKGGILICTSLLYLYVTAERCPSSCFCSKALTSVFCSGKKLTHFPYQIPTTVLKLYLDHNLITSIPVGAITNRSSLAYLDLRNNKITTIEPNAFLGCGQLSKLYLVTNSFTSIPKGAFNGASSLTYLSLSANRLRQIPSLRPLISLQVLVLEGNQIRDATFSKDSLQLKSLEHIVLSNNPIGVLKNNTFINLRNSPVVKLEISRCNIAKMDSNSFTPLKSIKSLKIGYNPLNEWQLQNMMNGLRSSPIVSLDIRNISLGGNLPARTFAMMYKIQFLTLRNNRINTIQNMAFVDLPLLIHIDLSSCSIMTIDAGAFYNLSDIQRLFLIDNKLTSVPRDLPMSLQILHLEKNEITTIKNDDFLNLSRLQELYLAYNQIHVLQENSFAGLIRLIKLHLDGNKIGNLPGDVFSPLVRLESLSLNKNNLQTIQDHAATFESLVSLIYLGLAGNQCSKLPIELFNPLVALRFLQLSNNSLGDIIKHDSEGKLFAGLTKLEILEIDGNQISFFPDSSFRQLGSMTNLSLARNQISHWSEHLFSKTPVLHRLDLSYNLITLVNQTSLSNLQHLHVLDLRKSPFTCSCDMRWFRNWINHTEVNLVDVNKWMCESPASWQGKTLLSFSASEIDCTNYTLYYILAGAVGGLILSILLVTVWYRKRYFVAFRFYRAKKFFKCTHAAYGGYQPIPGNDKKFDIFLSFAQEDCDWVVSKLLPKIDNGRVNQIVFHGNYKVCFSERDFNPSRSVVSNVDANLASSQSAFILLSKHYGQNRLCEFELDCIVHAAAEGDIKNFTVIVLGNLPAKYVPNSLRKIIENHKYIEFPNVNTAESDFFEKVTDILHAENMCGNIAN